MVLICKHFFYIVAPSPGIIFEIWDNIGGNRLGRLRKDPRYPNNPSKTETLTAFDTPVNRGNNYGARVITYYQVRHQEFL